MPRPIELADCGRDAEKGVDKPLEVAVEPLTRTEAQIAALRECAAAWHTGAERFWPFDDVLAMLERPVCHGFFAVRRAAPGHRTEAAPWLGFMMVDISGELADLLYIYVQPEQRGRGVGEALLAHLLDDLRRDPTVCRLLLEVRAHNTAALQLYRKMGLHQIGQRQKYYANGDDALVLSCDFAREGSCR